MKLIDWILLAYVIIYIFIVLVLVVLSKRGRKFGKKSEKLMWLYNCIGLVIGFLWCSREYL